MKGGDKLEWGFAHSEGKCDIVSVEEYSVVSAGADGQVRRYDTSPQALESFADPSLLYDHDHATCIAVDKAKDWIAVGFSDNQVHLLKYPSGEFESIITRLQLPPQHLAFSPTGLHLAVASEGSIKLVNLVDSTQVMLLKGHKGVVRSLAFDPKGEYLASSGADGTVRIWNLNDLCEVKHLEILPKGEQERPPLLSRLDWHPQGTTLAVPTDDAVLIVERNTWEITSKLSGEHKKGVNIFRWSPNGLYGASAGYQDNTLFIWQVDREETIDKITSKSPVLGVSWNPTSNSIALINEAGQWSNWQDVIPSALPNPHTLSEEISVAEEAKATSSSLIADLFQQNEEGEKRQSNREAELDDIFHREAEISEEVEQEGHNKMDLGEDEGDEEEEVYDEEEEGDAEYQRTALRSHSVVRIPPMKPQPAFQPNSGPSTEPNRYLAWTTFGLMKHLKEETSSHIEVEFTDTTNYKNFRLANLYNFTMAAMGPPGALFAAKSSDGFPANMMFRPFNSWTSNADWTIKMSAQEEIEAITVGASWCAASTDSGTVYIISTGGVQLSIFSLPGPAIAMAAHENLLAVAYHLTPPTRDRQNVEIKLLDVKKGECIAGTPIPLNAPRLTLRWIGFSDLGTLLVLDSIGQLYGLFNSFGWSFVPIFSFAELSQAAAEEEDPKNDQFWILGLKGEQLLCIPFEPDTEQPRVDDLPEIIGFSLSIPMVKDSPVGVDEERHIRNKLLINYKKFILQNSKNMKDDVLQNEIMAEQLDADKHLLGMIQKACQTSKAGRALDYAAQLIFPKSVAIAVRLAERSSLSELANRIGELLNQKADLLHSQKSVKEDKTKNQQTQPEDDEEELTQLPLTANSQKGKTRNKKRKTNRKGDDDSNSESESVHANDQNLSDHKREAKRRKVAKDQPREQSNPPPKRKLPQTVQTESEKKLLSSMFEGEEV